MHPIPAFVSTMALRRHKLPGMKASDRKKLLDMAAAREKSGSGSDLQTLREAPSRYEHPPSFLKGLEPVSYVIVGGLATARYMPERMTLDIDILIEASDLPAVERALASKGARKRGALSVGGSTWQLQDGKLLDVLALNADWVDEAIRGAERDETGLPVVALPYLVLMKLESGRLQDLADISRMMGCASAAHIDATRRIVSRYRPRDVEDLESMIRLGKLEHE